MTRDNIIDQKRPDFQYAEFIFQIAPICRKQHKSKGGGDTCDCPTEQRLWEGFQRLDAYYLMQYYGGGERSPSVPDYAKGYATADLLFCDHSYVDLSTIDEKTLAEYARAAQKNRMFELNIALAQFARCRDLRTLRPPVDITPNTVAQILYWVACQEPSENHSPKVPASWRRFFYTHDPVLWAFKYFVVLAKMIKEGKKIREKLEATIDNLQAGCLAEGLDQLFAQAECHNNSIAKKFAKLRKDMPYVPWEDKVLKYTSLQEIKQNELYEDFLRSKKFQQISGGLLGFISKIREIIDLKEPDKPKRRFLHEKLGEKRRVYIFKALLDLGWLITQNRREPFHYYKQFTLTQVSDLDIMLYFYDQTLDQVVKANWVISHLTWNSHLGDQAKPIRDIEALLAEGMDVQIQHQTNTAHFRPPLSRGRIAYLRHMYPDDFRAIVPIQDQYYDFVDIYQMNRVNKKYVFSNVPTMSVVNTTRLYAQESGSTKQVIGNTH